MFLQSRNNCTIVVVAKQQGGGAVENKTSKLSSGIVHFFSFSYLHKQERSRELYWEQFLDFLPYCCYLLSFY